MLVITGWEVTKSINNRYFPDMWLFNESHLLKSGIWFDALVQMIFSTNIGIGALPVITGKFLYKGDAVKTSILYICFNILINAIGVTYFLTQFNGVSVSSLYSELLPLTVIYDKTLTELDPLLNRLVPGLTYLMILISCVISIVIGIYTASKLLKRITTYVLSALALIAAIASLLCSYYVIPRVLDTRVTGTLIICALIIEIISIAWIYGARNVYTDLEFSIGRPILKVWIFCWIIIPVLLTAILVWWTIGNNAADLYGTYMPRWSPIAFSFLIIFILACVEIFRQVDYNFCSMITASTKPSKNWGPADPLVRHSWKQWRSVCEDTGERDFTLRRRGTRDYTNSIKRGQYPHARYGPHNRGSTIGSNSPNYSGSVFGDSAIEEDISVDKNYQNYNKSKFPITNSSTSAQTSYGSRKSSVETNNNTKRDSHTKKLYQRSSISDDQKYNVSRIEITPQESPTNYRFGVVRNPMARAEQPHPHYAEYNYGSFVASGNGGGGDHLTAQQQQDHICWRKYSGNSEEYSTEL